MKFHYLKKLTMVAAVAPIFIAGINAAEAQTTTTVGAGFATAGGLSSSVGTDMDFGTWVIDIQSAETITLPLLSTIPGPPAVPVPGGVTNSIVVNTVVPATSGTFTVTAPIATTLEIQGNVTNNFADASLSLGSLIYSDTVATDVALPAAYAAAVVTVVAGGVAETVGVGGTLTLSGVNPAASATFSDAIVTVDLRY